jgi:pyruvate/2-oxoacid:ferredoxin oxidoreductase alpha subunit
MGQKMVVSGNIAAAYAAKLCRPAVVAAYPITPQTTIVEKIAEFVNNGEMKCDYIRVESEHSALSACYGAEATGVRTFTATSSQGLALMHEILHVCAGARLPVGMVVVNRTLSAPIYIMAEWNDAMPERDSGWMMLWCESSQEVLDTVIMNYKVGESREVLLPQFCCLDSFILSHTYEPVDVPLQKEVDDFLPPLELEYGLDINKPICIAPLVDDRLIPEFRWNQESAMQNARHHIQKTTKEFYEKFGRDYGNGLIQEFWMDDARVGLLSMGTNISTAKVAVAKMRKEGEPVGLIKVRSFRPFPIKELQEIGKRLKVLGVLERSASFGSGGPLYLETRSALYNVGNQPIIIGFLAGLGGRDITVNTIKYCYEVLLKTARTGDVPKNFLQPNGGFYDHIDVRKG